MWSWEVVGSEQLSQGDPGLCWGRSGFSDCWFDIWACLGSHPSLATRKGATVEVVLAWCPICSSGLCLFFGPFETTDLYSKGSCASINFLASHQLAGSKMVLSRDHVVQKRWSCEVVGSHRCLFDISRPVVYLPSSMPANIPLSKLTANAPQVFFQAVFVIWPIWAHISTAKGSCVRSTTLGQPPASRVKMVLSRDHAEQKRWSCEVVGSDQFSQGDPGLCWGRSGFNWLLIWHFMASGIFVDFDASHHVLGSHPSLVTRKDATVEVVLATCHKCSSKLCLLFGRFGPTSLQPKRRRKNDPLGQLVTSCHCLN